jgi:hypothetical protein
MIQRRDEKFPLKCEINGHRGSEEHKDFGTLDHFKQVCPHPAAFRQVWQSDHHKPSSNEN